jgi:phosphate/sulfate permease
MEMPMWVWIVIGVGSFLGLSLLVGFVLARILGTLGREISELHQTDNWAMLPPTRASKALAEEQPQEQAKSSRVDRLMQHH